MTNALSAYFRRLRAEMGFGEKILEVTSRQEAASSGEQLQASRLSSSSREASLPELLTPRQSSPLQTRESHN